MAGQIISQTVVQVIAAAAGAVITVGFPLIITKLNKLSKVYTTMFGIDESESIKGLIDIVDENQSRIEEMKKNQRKIVDTQEDISDRIERISSKIDRSNDGAN